MTFLFEEGIFSVIVSCAVKLFNALTVYLKIHCAHSWQNSQPEAMWRKAQRLGQKVLAGRGVCSVFEDICLPEGGAEKAVWLAVMPVHAVAEALER